MNHRNASLVGNAFFFLACMSLPSCSSNDNVQIGGPSGGAGTAGAGSPTGGASTAGGTSATVQGGATAAGGQSTANGGASSQGGGVANGGQSTNEGGASSQGGAATGGVSATGGSSVVGTGGAAVGGATTGGAANGGTGTGGVGTGGAATGGATSNPVTPTQQSPSDYRFTMTACNVVMDVNPQVGARVAALTLSGTSVINPYTCSSYNPNVVCNNSGSTFWTSPQSGWDGNTGTPGDWPPVPEVDGSAYAPTISGTHLVATGTGNTALGASVTKDFSADAGTCWITLLYTINATKAVSMAPWEITRVPRGGIALFPQGNSGSFVPGPLISYTTTTTTTTPSIVWFDDSAKTATNASGSKLVADGASGWLAYALGSVLFIKKYTDVQPASFATGEGDVEIYADLLSGYLELEVQGANTALVTGGSLPWTVQWRVVAIPSSVTVAARDASLLTFVQQQVAM